VWVGRLLLSSWVRPDIFFTLWSCKSSFCALSSCALSSYFFCLVNRRLVNCHCVNCRRVNCRLVNCRNVGFATPSDLLLVMTDCSSSFASVFLGLCLLVILLVVSQVSLDYHYQLIYRLGRRWMIMVSYYPLPIIINYVIILIQVYILIGN
jgi:hypothetical protein